MLDIVNGGDGSKQESECTRQEAQRTKIQTRCNHSTFGYIYPVTLQRDMVSRNVTICDPVTKGPGLVTGDSLIPAVTVLPHRRRRRDIPQTTQSTPIGTGAMSPKQVSRLLLLFP